MKTKSITYACTQYGIVLIAFLATVSVSAQVQFASQRDNSFSGRQNLSAVSLLNYFAPAEQIARGRLIASMTFSSLVNNTAEGINFADKPGAIINLPLTIKDNSSNTGKAEIGIKRTSFTYPIGSGKDIGIAQYSSEQLILYATILKQYARKHGFDTTYAFFSNMGMLINKRRFFVVNLVTMKIEQSGLVAQGRGQGPSRFDKQYSNKKDSKCTSLGRYKIMNKYEGEYGIAYKMMGLDSSNRNAFKRNIVLHSMGCMPDREENMPVCISEGCPAVSAKFLSSLSEIIDSRKKPILLWIFDSNLEEIVIRQPVTPETAHIEERIFHKCSMHRISDNSMGMGE